MMANCLERYFQKYYAKCYRAAFALVKNRADAEDIAQEVLVRLLVYEPEFASEEHEKAWMLRTAINLAKDLLKSKWHNALVAIETVDEAEKSYLQIPDVETDDTLWMVLELPERFRNCLYLFYYEDYSIREIADILEEPENTVKSNLKRGREVLKRRLQERR
ncbi:MAG: sigma-70 family RNA polymerase sigma factor [Lachnospiraceae bacterium]|nr:sigma-70 family RNA polymerase sigma factor [Lachnospiraceae bacterium]